MRQNKKIEFNKPIVLDADRMNELYTILQKYSNKVSFRGITKEEAKIDFDSYEQLMRYSNYDKERLVSLEVRGRTWGENNDVDIDIELQPDPIFRRSVRGSFQFDDVEKARLFELELIDFLNRSVENYGSSIGLKTILWVVLIAIVTFLFVILLKKDLLKNNMASLFGGCMGSLSVVYMMNIGKITNKVFPKVSFVWGEEAKRYNRRAKLRSNLFWCVLVATIIAIGTGVLLSIIL